MVILVVISYSLCGYADDAGMKQSGVALNDIVLPPWAKGDPQEFIRMHREVGTRICRLHRRKFITCGLNCKDFTVVSQINTYER